MPTYSIIFNMNVFILISFASFIFLITPAPMLVNGTIRSPSFIVIGANTTTWVLFVWTIVNTDTSRTVIFIEFTNSTSSAMDSTAWIINWWIDSIENKYLICFIKLGKVLKGFIDIKRFIFLSENFNSLN